MARFQVHERGSVRWFDLGDVAVSVGAARDCGLPVDGQGVADEHLLLERSRAGWQVRRTARTAALLVNGVAMNDRRLRHGDRLQIGDVLLVFDSPNRPANERSA